MWSSRLLGSLALGCAAMAPLPAVAEERGGAQRDMVVLYAGDLGVTPGDAPIEAALSGAPLAGDELAQMRGGFALPGGLSVAFGFDIETRIGGAIMQRLTLPQVTIGGTGPTPVVQVTDAQGRTSALPLSQGLPSVVTDALNGGATRVTTQVGGGGIVGVVQNSRDGQAIQRMTSIGIDISGMRGMLDRAAARELLQGGLDRRTRFGR